MHQLSRYGIVIGLIGVLIGLGVADAQPPKPSSYMPVIINDDFATVMARMKAAKADVMKRQRDLLAARYDLANRAASGVTMARSKPVQDGVRVKLPAGVTWQQLGQMTPDEIRNRNAFPAGFLPLPHANHPEGGMVFPQFLIDEIKKQEARDLTRFDLDFDLPDHLLPEFPPPIFLTTRLDLGDVSKGKLVTIDNFFELFDGILNPKQIEGFRLLVTPFPQQQFNQTDDRRSERPSRGVACFDCHVNGHTPHAQPPHRALLPHTDDQRPDGRDGRADQDLQPARDQGFTALPARRAAPDTGRHRRVLQPDPRRQADRAREEGPGGGPARALTYTTSPSTRT
jgi:cytochrome c peroxidase